jgi:PIN domain nuclease of toxin-antitoxin system
MVMLDELEMLREKGAIKYAAPAILADLNQQIGVSVCQLPMAVVVNSALSVKWTREPGDRMIVANAIANNEVPLITSDRRIQEQYPNSIDLVTGDGARSGVHVVPPPNVSSL